MHWPKEQHGQSPQLSWYKRLGTETFGVSGIPQLNSAGHVDMAKQAVPRAAVQVGQTSWVAEASSGCQWHFYTNCESRAMESQLWDEPFLHLGIHLKPHQAKVRATWKPMDHIVPQRGLCLHERCVCGHWAHVQVTLTPHELSVQPPHTCRNLCSGHRTDLPQGTELFRLERISKIIEPSR